LETELLTAVADWLLDHRPLPFISSQHDFVPAPTQPDQRILIIIPDDWVRFAPVRPRIIWMPETSAMAAKLVGTIRTISFDREHSNPDRLLVKWSVVDDVQSFVRDWIVTRDAQGHLAITLADPSHR
jgi:hypothetical protein